VSFFKSLICLQGHDDRFRFLSISIGSFLIFAFLSAINPEAYFSNTIILLLTSAILACTVTRRLNDVRLVKTWLLICTGTFVLCGAIITVVASPLVYGLMVLPIACILLLATYPSDKEHSYILGYAGPVDLSEYIKPTTIRLNRIEPSFGNNTASDISMNANVQQPLQESTTRFKQPNTANNRFNERFKDKVANIITSKKALVTIAAFALIFIISISIMASNSTSTIEVEESSSPEPVKQIKDASLERNFTIEFSDNFSLMISQHSGLILYWQADTTEKSLLWQQLTASGDKTCSAITFNNKQSIRTLSVSVEEGDEYYAQFSPLDTQQLLKELAYRGSFSLCDYKFSLKGSQAVLGKNSPYNRLVSL